MKQVPKILSMALIASLCSTAMVPVLAQTDAVQVVTTQDQAESTVTINSSSSFKVTVPSTITVNQPSKAVLNETYNVKVEGDITGEETITVAPDVNFNLSQPGKTDVEVTVTQNKTEFTYNEIDGTNGLTTTGKLTTDTEVTAGSWVGNLTFNINVETRTPFTLNSSNYSLAGIERTGNVVIPSTFEYGGVNYRITQIADSAFKDCRNITSVTIPDSVRTIGYQAFMGCINITNINLGNSLTDIGDYAFAACTSLTNITIPDSVTSIGESAFNGCTSLNSVIIGNSVKTIGERAFQDCSNLTSVTIPDTVTRIDYWAFRNVPHINYNGSATGSPWGAQTIN